MSEQENHLISPAGAALATAGGMLAARRVEMGLGVVDVSAKLKLSKRQVEALEADRYADLPGNTFVKGFVRNYARLLEMDSQPLLAYLDRHLPAETPQAALPRLSDESMPLMRPGGRSNGRAWRILFLVVLIVGCLGAGGYWLFQHGLGDLGFSSGTSKSTAITDASRLVPVEPQAVPAAPAVATTETPQVPAGMGQLNPANSSAAGASGGASVVKPEPEATPGSDLKPGEELRLVAKQDSWMQVIDASGKSQLNELLKAGDSRIVLGVPPYRVRIGNAKHAEVFFRGKQVDLAPVTKVDVASLELK